MEVADHVKEARADVEGEPDADLVIVPVALTDRVLLPVGETDIVLEGVVVTVPVGETDIVLDGVAVADQV